MEIGFKMLLVFCLCFFKIQTTFLSKIPQKYISDSNFISMTLKAQSPVKKIYASPKGHGSTCSSESPCLLSTAVENLKPGYILYLKGGEYNIGKGISIKQSGSSDKYIVITAVKGETPIITSSSKNTEITLVTIQSKVSYIIIENLTFKSIMTEKVQGIIFKEGGQNHIIIRNNVFSSLKAEGTENEYDAGAVMLVGDTIIKNVMIYNNKIINNYFGYGESISVMGNCENIYVLNNTLKNNDNMGIDFSGNNHDCKSDSSLDQPRKSVAMFNRVERSYSPFAHCTAIYVDGAKDIYIYDNTVYNNNYGIEVGGKNNRNKNPITNIVVENNKVVANEQIGIIVGGYDIDSLVVRNTVFKNNIIKIGQTSIIIGKSNGITFVGNKISDMNDYFVEMKKEFTNSIKNVIFEKNFFSGNAKFIIYGKTMILEEFIDIYNTNKM